MKLRELLALIDTGHTFHFVDTETSGSSPASSRVIELATVSLRHGRVVGRFETLIDPGVHVPSWITRLTGITGQMLVGAPAPAEAYAAWDAYLADVGHGAFVAHNAPFDWGFLNAEYARLERPWPFERPHCTVRLARKCLPQLRSRSLQSLIAYYEIDVSARHRALADAEATAEVFNRLIAAITPASV
ncbi:MAG: polymerase epsilon subunit [Cyanobacteria bacterium RYN_339]|nr:polymerase epsilon subunit [Cyanobacteria bacterium RYN_339]